MYIFPLTNLLPHLYTIRSAEKCDKNGVSCALRVRLECRWESVCLVTGLPVVPHHINIVSAYPFVWSLSSVD